MHAPQFAAITYIIQQVKVACYTKYNNIFTEPNTRIPAEIINMCRKKGQGNKIHVKDSIKDKTANS